jgi:type II secretory pathway pseudopilin PulG
MIRQTHKKQQCGFTLAEILLVSLLCVFILAVGMRTFVESYETKAIQATAKSIQYFGDKLNQYFNEQGILTDDNLISECPYDPAANNNVSFFNYLLQASSQDGYLDSQFKVYGGMEMLIECINTNQSLSMSLSSSDERLLNLLSRHFPESRVIANSGVFTLILSLPIRRIDFSKFKPPQFVSTSTSQQNFTVNLPKCPNGQGVSFDVIPLQVCAATVKNFLNSKTSLNYGADHFKQRIDPPANDPNEYKYQPDGIMGFKYAANDATGEVRYRVRYMDGKWRRGDVDCDLYDDRYNTVSGSMPIVYVQWCES